MFTWTILWKFQKLPLIWPYISIFKVRWVSMQTVINFGSPSSGSKLENIWCQECQWVKWISYYNFFFLKMHSFHDRSTVQNNISFTLALYPLTAEEVDRVKPSQVSKSRGLHFGCQGADAHVCWARGLCNWRYTRDCGHILTAAP